MRTLIRAMPLTLAAALIALFAIACSSGSTDSEVDDTAREISSDELAQMVLALEDFGGGYLGFQADDGNGVLTSEQVIGDDNDSEDEAEDLEKYGFASGFGADFDNDAALEEVAGVYSVGSQVLLFEDAEGAAGYYADTVEELNEAPEKSGEGFDAVEVEHFNVDAGDEAKGFVISGHIVPEEGDPLPIWIMASAFRHGRILGLVSMWSLEDRSSEDALNGWARVMDQRITTVLAGAAVSDEPSGPSGEPVSDEPSEPSDELAIDEPSGPSDELVSDEPSGPSDGLVSAAPLEVLSASAESFEEEVESLQMEMEITVNAGGFVVDASSEMAFQAPNQMHMTMDITGLGSFEMLMLGTDIYMNIPMQGWVVMSLDDLGLDELGLDVTAFQDSFSNHSIVDYTAIIESVGGDVEDLGEETVDGGTYRHYRGTVDFADVAAAFGDTFEATADMDLESTGGPLTFDAWVDPETFLPYMLTATGEFAFGADAMVFDASMRFSGYNEPVEMPDPPEDAVPFALLGGP